jgi:hypothetical protein
MPAVSNFISRAWRNQGRRKGLSRELASLLFVLLFGILLLPPLIWVGGRMVLGPYISDPLNPEPGGPFALWLDYLQGLVHGNPGYWLACLGLYGTFLATRIARAVLKV